MEAGNGHSYHAAVTAPSPLRQALANREIRLAETAWMLGIAAEGAFVVALLVYAYQIGGIVEVGLASLARTLPAGILAPFIAGLADRLPRHRLLLAVHAARGITVALLALVAALGGGAVLLLLLAALEGVLASLHRPSNAALLPALARAPEELVASNVVSGAGENLGSLAGPALAAGLVTLFGVGAALVAPAAAFGAAALAISRVRPAQQPAHAPAANRRGWTRALAGIAALREHPSAAVLAGIGMTQTFVRGAMTVMLVAAAAQLMSLGEQGIGVLQAAIGLGGIAGAVAGSAFAGRRRLSGAMVLGLVLWGLPITVIGLVPNAVVAIAVLTVLGIGNAIFDVGLFSLIQRNVPNRVRGSVFGACEGLFMLGVAAGSLAAPFIVRLAGLQGGLVVTGLLLPVVALLTASAIRRADLAAIVPERQMRLLRGVAVFQPLPLTVVEQIAGSLEPMSFSAGQEVCTQGEPGDRFFIIDAGRAEVEQTGTVLRHLEEGDSFGEIALLRSVARTATVRAEDSLRTFSLKQLDFVSAVTGNPQAAIVADGLIQERLSEDVARA
jgi:MFS family permease